MQNLFKFTYGVRFKHTFRLNDISGEIIDKVLYKNDYFSVSDFKNVSRDGNGFVLFTQDDPENNDVFRMAVTDMIYTHVLKDENLKDILRKYTEILSRFFAPEIIEKYNLITQRIGIVYQSSMDQETHRKVSAQYFKGEFDDSLEFKFSKKATVPIACINANRNDYVNKLFSSSRIADNNHMFAYDYQHFFDPHQAYISDKVEKIIKSSYEAYTTDIDELKV